MIQENCTKTARKGVFINKMTYQITNMINKRKLKKDKINYLGLRENAIIRV